METKRAFPVTMTAVLLLLSACSPDKDDISVEANTNSL
jgi:protein involved in sex pheromone biosynthesis